MSRRAQDQNDNFLDRIADWVDRVPRPTRILMNMTISVIIMGLIGVPIVLAIAGSAVNDPERGDELYLPLIIVSIIWLAIYAYGWWALVGFDWDEEEEWQARRPAALMVLLGGTATLVLMFACMYGFLFALAL